jgi:hypothetical protein
VPADAAHPSIVAAAGLSWGQGQFPTQKSICIPLLCLPTDASARQFHDTIGCAAERLVEALD